VQHQCVPLVARVLGLARRIQQFDGHLLGLDEVARHQADVADLEQRPARLLVEAKCLGKLKDLARIGDRLGQPALADHQARPL
jgi:hypothetical protein